MFLHSEKHISKKHLANKKIIYTFAYSNTFLFLYRLSKVLNISEAATIAIHSMGIIARSKDSLNVQQIADLTGFSKNHTAKVLQQLVKNNFLTSSRGPKGGFIIKKNPSTITLMDIYKIIEGDIETEETLCKMHCDNCPFSNCIFGGLNEKFNREFKDYLMEKTLATI